MSRQRVAITGLGAITPIGKNVADFWDGLIHGRSGIGPITQFDPEAMNCRVAASIDDYEPSDYFDSKLARKIEPFVQFAIISAREAYEDSGLKHANLDPTEIGCLMGVGIGGIGYTSQAVKTLNERGPGKISPFLIPKIICNMSAGYVAIDQGFKGPNFSIVTACAAGTHSIGEAGEIIRRGWAKAMIAGGSEAAICPVSVAGFDRMKALCGDHNDDPIKASRPFDATRTGFVMGEGSGSLVLEDWDFAVARGARILAELSGYGASSDAYHITQPSPGGEGGARAMELAVRHCGLDKSEIGYVNAHGTSTQLNDKLETNAIKTVFGSHAHEMAVSSNKSMIGHLLGAAGGVEAVATVKTLQEQLIPPTINLDRPDPECDLDYVPHEARRVKDLRAAISNSLGFGGHNASIVIGLPD